MRPLVLSLHSVFGCSLWRGILLLLHRLHWLLGDLPWKSSSLPLVDQGFFQRPTVVCFIDFMAAFDSFDGRSRKKILEADGFPQKLLQFVQAYFRSTKSRVLGLGDWRCLKSTQVSVTDVRCPPPSSISSLTGFSGAP